MNLTDIEKAVVELSFRHPGLTKEFLRTLLEASGWEEKHIKEAQIIYAAHLATAAPIRKEQEVLKEDLPVSSISVDSASKVDDMTFLRSDGTEEGELHIEEPKDVEKRELKEKKLVHSLVEEVDEEKIPAPAQELVAEEIEEIEEKNEVKEKEDLVVEEESLVKEDAFLRQEKSQVWSELPDNLPLVPFESAPHVWSFGRYKDTFYNEPKVEEKKTEAVTTTTTYVEEKKEASTPAVIVKEIPQVPFVSQSIPPKKEPEIEIDFEKIPISRGEESLVVLAGIMLLAIMLILGYMYGNGRL